MKVCACVCACVLTVVWLALNDATAETCVGQDLGGVHALEESVEGHREGWGWVGGLKGKGFSLSFCVVEAAAAWSRLKRDEVFFCLIKTFLPSKKFPSPNQFDTL
jgi:hypothetical protein